MNIEPGDKALVTTNEWFYAPNGKSYKAVYGTVKAVRTAEQSLGIKPNGKSANWYLEIGSITIAGCQIHYAVRCDDCNLGNVKDWSHSAEHGARYYVRPSLIFNADG